MSDGGDVRIIENFVDDPWAERNYALDLPYGDVTAQGHTYKNIALPNSPNYSMWAMIQRLHQPSVIPIVDFYRLNIGSEPDSTWNIHSDVNFSEMIAIHYLNHHHCRGGGTSIWRHKTSGALKPSNPPTKAEELLYGGDRNDIDKWELIRHIEMKFNRLVAFDSRLFHSREPRDLACFGDDPETARLVHVFFYNLR